ncbi:MAG: glycosyltransferase family 4 protein [Acidimicrobiales bacterium]|nr:glycosyltransferase family 4 protein [Acidimicrobiales bacterium]
MRILVIAPHYTPDTAPTGTVITTITDALVDRGHDLTMVSSLPWYRHHRVESGWGGKLVRRERTAQRTIVRLHPLPSDKGSLVRRAVAFGGFTIEAAVAALLQGPRPDVVLAMSPPLTLGVAGWVAATRWRVPYVFNIQDVFPDVAVDVGAITNRHVIRAASALERWCYRRADAVTVLSEDLRRNVAAKIGPERESRVHVIPNFVDVDQIRPGPRINAYRAEFGLGDGPVVMYAGNLGHSQPLDLVMAAARRHPHVRFVINGGGVARAELERQAADLANVVFVDYQPAERLPEVLAAADVHLVLLKPRLASASVPSKLYSILAAGRAVLASVDPDTEVSRVRDTADAGRWTPAGDTDAFVAAVGELAADPVGLAAMGERGRDFVSAWQTPAAVAERYEELFVALRSERS